MSQTVAHVKRDLPKLWFVSPIYHDVPSWLMVHKALSEHLTAFADDFSSINYLVVDDSAGLDPQVGQLAPMKGVVVETPPFNLGHQRALVYGLRRNLARIAAADVVVTLDGDGEDRPEDLPRLLAPLLSPEETDPPLLVLAQRTKRQAPLAFKLMYVLYAAFFRVLTGTIVKSGNYAAYRGHLAHRILSHPYFDLCYSATLLTFDLPTRLVPCSRGTRYTGESKMSYSRLILHGLRMLMPFTDRIAIRAIIAFTAVLSLCAGAAAGVLGIRYLTTAAIPGWATYTLLLILMLSFVALGNLMVLLVAFSQLRGFSLSNLERTHRDGPVE